MQQLCTACYSVFAGAISPPAGGRFGYGRHHFRFSTWL